MHRERKNSSKFVGITILRATDYWMMTRTNLWHIHDRVASRALSSVRTGLPRVILFEGIGCPFNRCVNVRPITDVRDQCHETRINLDFYTRDSCGAINGQFGGKSGTGQTFHNLLFTLNSLSGSFVRMSNYYRACLLSTYSAYSSYNLSTMIWIPNYLSIWI